MNLDNLRTIIGPIEDSEKTNEEIGEVVEAIFRCNVNDMSNPTPVEIAKSIRDIFKVFDVPINDVVKIVNSNDSSLQIAIHGGDIGVIH